jgi:hypothetical protein
MTGQEVMLATNFFPGYDVVGVSFVIGEAAIKLISLGLGQRYRGAVRRNAIPEFFNQRQALLDSEALDTQRFE